MASEPARNPPPLEVARPAGGWPLAAALVAGTLAVYALRYVLLPFVIGGALAYIVEPAIRWLQRRLRLPRWLVVVPIYILYLALFAGLGYLIGWRILVQLHQFSGSVRGMLDDLLQHILGGERISWGGQKLDATQIANHLVEQAGQWLGSGATVAEAARFALLGAGGLTLTLVLLVYFMLGGAEVIVRVVNLAPPSVRPRLRDLLDRVDPILGRYVRGLFLIVAVTSFLAWLGIEYLLQLRGALLLALATGVLELVPALGPILSVLLVSVAALEHGQISVIVKLAIYCTALRLFIDQLLGPVILGQAARIPPLAVLFAFVTGGTLFGPLGLILAVPTAAIIKILLDAAYQEGSLRVQLPRALFRKKLLPQPLDEPH